MSSLPFSAFSEMQTSGLKLFSSYQTVLSRLLRESFRPIKYTIVFLGFCGNLNAKLKLDEYALFFVFFSSVFEKVTFVIENRSLLR